MMGPSLIPAAGGGGSDPALEGRVSALEAADAALDGRVSAVEGKLVPVDDALTVITSSVSEFTTADVVRIDEFDDRDYADVELVSGGAAGSTGATLSDKAHGGCPGAVKRVTMTVGQLKAYIGSGIPVEIGAGGVDDGSLRLGGVSSFGFDLYAPGPANENSDAELLRYRDMAVVDTVCGIPVIFANGDPNFGVEGPMFGNPNVLDGPAAGGSMYGGMGLPGGRSGIYPSIQPGYDSDNDTGGLPGGDGQGFGSYGAGGGSTGWPGRPGGKGGARGGGGGAGQPGSHGGDGGRGEVIIRLRKKG
jgi:hypothetical protein